METQHILGFLVFVVDITEVLRRLFQRIMISAAVLAAYLPLLCPPSYCGSNCCKISAISAKNAFKCFK